MDLSPLLHFWGVPTPEYVKDFKTLEGVPVSENIRLRLEHYKTLVPADASAFAAVYDTMIPLIGGAEKPQWDLIKVSFYIIPLYRRRPMRAAVCGLVLLPWGVDGLTGSN